MSAYCARHGLTVAELVHVNGMLDVAAPDAHRHIANLVSQRNPTTSCVYPVTPNVAGSTENMRAVQMALYYEIRDRSGSHAEAFCTSRAVVITSMAH